MLVINQKLPEKGIIVEEPEVVKIISSYLNNINSINVRGFLINSGKYNGEDFVISTHGIGSPSTAFILEELINNGVKTIIRYGTAGTSDTDFLPVKRGFQALGLF
jgi:uridine phosphorylase